MATCGRFQLLNEKELKQLSENAHNLYIFYHGMRCTYFIG